MCIYIYYIYTYFSRRNWLGWSQLITISHSTKKQKLRRNLDWITLIWNSPFCRPRIHQAQLLHVDGGSRKHSFLVANSETITEFKPVWREMVVLSAMLTSSHLKCCMKVYYYPNLLSDWRRDFASECKKATESLGQWQGGDLVKTQKGYFTYCVYIYIYVFICIICILYIFALKKINK